MARFSAATKGMTMNRRPFARRGLGLSVLAGVMVLSPGAYARAQSAAAPTDAAPTSVSLSFQAASARLNGVSSVRRAADANVVAAQAGAMAPM